jgi:hypothetical protein
MALHRFVMLFAAGRLAPLAGAWQNFAGAGHNLKK